MDQQQGRLSDSEFVGIMSELGRTLTECNYHVVGHTCLRCAAHQETILKVTPARPAKVYLAPSVIDDKSERIFKLGQS